MSWLSSLVGGGIVDVVEGVGNVIDKFVETDEEKTAAEILKKKIAQQPHLAQVELNKIEAGHRSVFVAGWRPFIGWIAGVGLGFYFIPQYAVATYLWVKLSLELETLAPYPVSADGLLELVLAMLGMGGLRTLEKITGKAK